MVPFAPRETCTTAGEKAGITQIYSLIGDAMSKKLGQDIDFDFSQQAIMNINRLLKLFKMRLASRGKAKTTHKDGNVIYIDSDIYSTDQLVGFLVLSLSDF